jgi:hypothetical protein
VYVICSHARTRKDAEADRPREENLKRLQTVSDSADRDHLFRFTLNAQGEATEPEVVSLAEVLDNHPMLGRARGVPSKEGGVDIEGIAAHNGALCVGFRGPVLRGNLTPALKVRFATAGQEASLVFVTLDGLGFRDLDRTQDGFLVLAGPVGDGPGGYHLYHWDGGDCMPGEAGVCTHLCQVPDRSGGKPEGLAVLHEDAAGYTIMLVFDGLKDGGPTRYHLPRQR